MTVMGGPESPPWSPTTAVVMAFPMLLNAPFAALAAASSSLPWSADADDPCLLVRGAKNLPSWDCVAVFTGRTAFSSWTSHQLKLLPFLPYDDSSPGPGLSSTHTRQWYPSGPK